MREGRGAKSVEKSAVVENSKRLEGKPQSKWSRLYLSKGGRDYLRLTLG